MRRQTLPSLSYLQPFSENDADDGLEEINALETHDTKNALSLNFPVVALTM
jgi:hypothetical protein